MAPTNDRSGITNVQFKTRYTLMEALEYERIMNKHERRMTTGSYPRRRWTNVNTSREVIIGNCGG